MKKEYVLKIIILFIIGAIFSSFPFIWKNQPFLEYTLLDVVTGIVITYGIYYFSKVNDEKNNKVSKIDKVIDVFRKRITLLFDKPIDVENNKEEYLHSFKYLDNKFKLLEHMTNSFNCKNEIANIKENLEKIETYITDNINEKNEYFIHTDRKEKIPNLVDNIDGQLDIITIKLFSFDENK